jgi:hypothetical protein
MTASADDARLVLRKWLDDRSALMVFAIDRDRFSSFFPGVVKALSDSDLTIGGNADDPVGLRLNLTGASFEYANPRDFPLLAGYSGTLPLSSSLLFRFPNDFICALFEIGTPIVH